MNNYLISDLDEEYVGYLYKHIPILAYGIDEKGELYNSKLTPYVNGTLLLQLILNYCKECKVIRTTLKYYNIRDKSLYEINLFLNKLNKLNKMNKTEKKLNGFNNIENNNKSKITYNKNIVTKSYEIDALGLIEGIILCTLNYYKNRNKNNNKKFPNINVSISNNETKLNLKMNIAPGKDLGNYIIDLYKKNINVNDKNSELFNILIEISRKLDYLQKNCGFIHGDFHSGNIFVNKKVDENNGREKYIITFIDFEYSTIKLPSNKNIILTSPVTENRSRSDILNLDEDGLKALDIFHLIEDLKTFQMKNKTVREFNGNFKKFQDFIDKLDRIYPNKELESKIHISTRKKDFFNNSFSNLYPENFSTIELNNFPKIPSITTKRQIVNSHYSHHSPPKSSSRPNNLSTP